jgi:hypothetical protein
MWYHSFYVLLSFIRYCTFFFFVFQLDKVLYIHIISALYHKLSLFFHKNGMSMVIFFLSHTLCWLIYDCSFSLIWNDYFLIYSHLYDFRHFEIINCLWHATHHFCKMIHYDRAAHSSLFILCWALQQVPFALLMETFY